MQRGPEDVRDSKEAWGQQGVSPRVMSDLGREAPGSCQPLWVARHLGGPHSCQEHGYVEQTSTGVRPLWGPRQGPWGGSKADTVPFSSLSYSSQHSRP